MTRKLTSQECESLTRDFKTAAVDLCRKINKETAGKYQPCMIPEMLETKTPDEVARQLIVKTIPSGIKALEELELLDLSFERLVLEDRWDGLFEDDVLKEARRRLSPKK